MRLKVMTYNILVGGLGPAQRDRTEELLAVIASERPDVIALQECAGFLPEERDTLKIYERRLGMIGLAVRARSTLHLALLARPELDPRLETSIGEPFRHAALRATIAVRVSGQRLAFVAAHLNPFHEDARLSEAQRLLDLVPPGTPALVMGDFNGLSAQDEWPAAKMQALLEQYRTPSTSKSLGNSTPECLQTRALDRLREGGLVDLAFALADGDRSTTYPTPGAPAPEGPPIRIDYALATPDVVRLAKRLRVVRTAAAEMASDHFPLVCELELPDPA